MWAVLLAQVALADPPRLGLRGDFGLGGSTMGFVAGRLGVSPEVWEDGWGAGVRVGFDADTEAILGGEVDFLGFQPWALAALSPRWVLGGGLGAAHARAYPGFSLGPFAMQPIDATPLPRWVGTAAVEGGYLSKNRWIGVFLRADASTWWTAAVTLELNVSPGFHLKEAR